MPGRKPQLPEPFTIEKLVAMMDGRIWADSRPGEGSRFWFRLPRARDEAQAASAAPA